MKITRKFSAWILLFSIFLNLIMTGVNASNLYKKFLPSGLKYSDLPRTIENYVNNHKRTTCGMNVIVYDRDGIIYENSFGYIDKESMVKSDLDSVYEWGSISKLMIWVSVMQLYEKGKLDLNVDIKNYLPENFLKNLSYDKPITMIDLMNHKAGFQDTYFIQTTDASEITTLEDALSIRSPKQVYEPGEHTAYSNWSAALAALIVQRVSGMDYVEYVHKNILKPLSMDHTSIGPKYDDNTWVKSERQKQKCYDIEGEEIGGKAMYYIHLFPAGSAAGTISDLQKFARALTPDDKNPSPLFEKKRYFKRNL